MSLTFGISTKRRPTVVFKNYTFTKYKETKSHRIIWRCKHFQKYKCRAEIHTYENKMLDSSRIQHSHSVTTSDSNATQRHDTLVVQGRDAELDQCSSTESVGLSKDEVQRLYCILSSLASSENDEDATSDRQPIGRMTRTSPEKGGQLITQYATKSSTKLCKNMKSNASGSSTDDEEELSRYTLKAASKRQLRKKVKPLRSNKDRKKKWICY